MEDYEKAYKDLKKASKLYPSDTTVSLLPPKPRDH